MSVELISLQETDDSSLSISLSIAVRCLFGLVMPGCFFCLTKNNLTKNNQQERLLIDGDGLRFPSWAHLPPKK